MHTAFFSAPDDVAQMEALVDFNRWVVLRALELGGTCTGEHGVGMGKQQYLVAEHGLASVALMRQIKQLLDPRAILNPGKVVSGVAIGN